MKSIVLVLLIFSSVFAKSQTIDTSAKVTKDEFIKMEQRLKLNEIKVDRVMNNLTLFYNQRKKGISIAVWSTVIPTMIGIINCQSQQKEIKRLNVELAAQNKASQYQFAVDEILAKIDRRKKLQKNVFIGTTVVSIIGVLSGEYVIASAYKYISEAGSLTLSINQISYSYRF